MKNYIFLLMLLFGLSLQAQNWESLEYEQDQPNLEHNPLKGIAANFGSNNGFPHSISNRTFTYGELVNDIGDFEFEAIDAFLEEQAQAGRFSMIQINIDNAELINPLIDDYYEDFELEEDGVTPIEPARELQTYKGAQHDLPDFLNSVNRLYYQGNRNIDNQVTDVNENVFPLSMTDNAGNPSMVVDYNDPVLVDAMIALITALGTRYNGDDRLFIMHYGMYGIFGEWDLGSGRVYIDDLVDDNQINLGLQDTDWEMSDFNQGRIIDAFQNAFTTTNLVARVPDLPRSESVGYSDGLYFGASLSDEPQFNYFFSPLLKRFNADQNWKNHIIGGEMDPILQGRIWGELSAVNDFNYTVIGDTDRTGGVAVPQNVEDVFEQTHPTFIFQNYVLQDFTIGLEGENHQVTGDIEVFPYQGQSNQTFWDNAIKATKKMGYTLYVNEFNLSASGGNPAVEVNIQNTGVAPMYANWDVEFGYLDTESSFISLGVFDTWNLNTILPDVVDNKRTYISTESLDDGEYTFMLRIVNPLNEGIVLPDGTPKIYPNAQPVRFANTTQDVNLNGWLTLGNATIIDGMLGDFPEAVTSLERDESYKQIMNLDTQQELNVIVAPVATPITWVSNLPQIANVDQNGMVTTFTSAGDVEIKAFTADGQEVVFDITVTPYWEIPRLIEAENFFEYTKGSPSNPGARELTIEAGEDAGDTTIGFIGDFDIFEYAVTVKQDTDFVLDFRAVSISGPGDSKVELLREIDETTDILIEEVTFGGQGVPNGTYGTFSSGIFSLTEGNHIIKLRVTRSNFDLNWIRFKTCFTTTRYTIAEGWDNGVPDASVEAIIDEDYDTSTMGLGNISACSLIVSSNASLTVADGNFIEIENDITVEGTLNIAHQGSLVQVAEDAVTINNGNINIEKTTPSVEGRNFVALSSPMSGETRDQVYGNARAVFGIIPANFIPFDIDLITFPEFDGAENFLDDNLDYLDEYTGTRNLPDAGIGLLVFPSPDLDTPETTYDLTYDQGTLNSGTITVPINYNGPETTNNYNLLGNPYASAIDISAFITSNDAVNEVYYWEHITSPSEDLPGFGSSNFSMNDISIRNALVGISAVNGGTSPGEFMASGQGFAIKADQSQAVSNTAITFTNSIRVTGNNDDLRTSETTSTDLLWLNLTTNAYEDAVSQTAIGFVPQATPGFDPGYDSVRLGTFISLFTTLETGEQLAIQGREVFNSEIELTLGFATTVETEEVYTISIDNFEGINISNAPVYLIDQATNEVVNLKETDFNFTAQRGIQPERFTIVFQERDVLDIDEVRFRESVTLYPNPAIQSEKDNIVQKLIIK